MRHVSYALLLFVIISVVLVGLALRNLLQMNLAPAHDFVSCAKQGNPILESYPRQCKTPNGKSFTEVVPTRSATDAPQLTPSTQENIRVFEPTRDDRVESPFFLLGEARVFENVLAFRLTDDAGTVLAEGSLTADSKDVGQFGQFDKTIFYSTARKEGVLEVFSHSAKDGSEINTVRIPVTF